MRGRHRPILGAALGHRAFVVAAISTAPNATRRFSMDGCRWKNRMQILRIGGQAKGRGLRDYSTQPWNEPDARVWLKGSASAEPTDNSSSKSTEQNCAGSRHRRGYPDTSDKVRGHEAEGIP